MRIRRHICPSADCWRRSLLDRAVMLLLFTPLQAQEPFTLSVRLTTAAGDH